MKKSYFMGALALVLSLCFISSAIIINSGDDSCNQDNTLGVPGYDVYLEKNGGVGDDYYFASAPSPYLWGSNMVPSPTKDGYIFAGWYYDKELTVSIDEGNDSITGLNYNYFPDSPGTGINTTIYAKWIKTPIDGTVLSDDGNRLITAPSSAVDYVIPDGVTTIAGYAFFKCNNMQSIKFPEGVTTLEAHTFDGLGLITVYIPHSATYMDAVPPFFDIIRTYPAPTADNNSSHNIFEIRTSDDLKNFSLSSNISGNTYEGKTVYLANNLDMTNVSMGSIGDRSDSQFKGTFYGQGYVISNLEIPMHGGLFYHIGTGGLVKNLGLYNCYMHGEGSQNSVFVTENYGTIRNCYANECNVSWEGIDSHGAGFVYSNHGLIENCYSNTSCKGDNTLCAGNDGTITNTYYLQDASHNGIGIGKTAEEMKNSEFSVLLGSAYVADTENVNGGYPVLLSASVEEDLNFTTPGAIDSISGSSFNYIPGANITGTTFTKVSGADWMSFSNGKITGTAPSVTEKTSYQAVLKAVSPLGQERTQTITVDVYPVAQITASSNVINALAGQSITPLVLLSNIPCTYSMSGTLPDGLSFDPNTATFSGSTSAKGKYTVTVTGTTTEGIVQNPTIQVTVNVADVLSITSVPPSGLQLTSSLYTYTPVASVSGVTWTIENAPDWLVVSENKVTGTVPPLSDATTFTYILKATYVYESITQEKTQEVTITVEPALAFTTVPTASMVIVPVYSYNPDGTPVLGANAGGNNESRHTGTYKFVYTGEGATSLLWDFGDGTTSEDWTAVHIYEKSGTYTVTLTATNEKGSTTCTQELTVDLGDSGSDLVKYALVALIGLCVLYIAYSLIPKRNNRRR